MRVTAVHKQATDRLEDESNPINHPVTPQPLSLSGNQRSECGIERMWAVDLCTTSGRT
jgi:hypothetical protein